eukprot:6606707-Ditylum_brightwellii.AAC.1
MDSKKGDGASPIVSIESVLLSATIDMHERRKVVRTDIPGAYLNTDMEDDVFMVLKGVLAEMFVRVAPQIYC